MPRRTVRLALLCVVLACASPVRAADSRIRHVRPPAPGAPRYSQAVVVESGPLVFVSGQVAYDAQRHVVGKGDMRAQTKQAFENLKAVLAVAGTDLAHVVRLNAYLTDLGQLQAHREARNEYIDAANPPASTLVGVARLVDPDLLLELEAVAVVPEATPEKKPR